MYVVFVTINIDYMSMFIVVNMLYTLLIDNQFTSANLLRLPLVLYHIFGSVRAFYTRSNIHSTDVMKS